MLKYIGEKLETVLNILDSQGIAYIIKENFKF